MSVLDKLPQGIRPAFAFKHVNTAITLYKGELEFSGAFPEPIAGDSTITWKWLPKVGPRFQADVNDVHELGSSNSVRVAVPGQVPVSTLVSSTQGLKAGTITGMLPQLVIGDGASLDRLIFHVPNFVNYIGSLIRNTTKNAVNSRTGRLSLSAGGWQVHIDNLPDTKEKIKSLKAEGGYGITHIGILKRKDSSRFAYSEAREILDAIGYFLTFLRGFWSQPILAVGQRSEIDNNRANSDYAETLTVAERKRLDPWRTVQSWFSKFIADEMPTLFRKFWRKWQNPAENQVLREVIGTYLEANGKVSLQSQIVLAQVGLETMAYEVLTDAQGNEPSGSAEDKISSLLKKQGTPDGIPNQLSKLSHLSKESILKDNPPDPDLNGPQTIVRIRNALVHSKRAKRHKRQKLNTDHYKEAWQLSLWYLELVLLAWLGYEGKYSCRLKQGFEGDLDYVPWSPSP